MNKYNVMNTMILVGVAVGAVWYFKGAAASAVKSVGTAVNPADSGNLANRAVQSTWDLFTDGQGTIGTDTYDFIHGE